MRRLGVCLLALGACAGGLHQDDVTRAFAQDHATVVLRAPVKDDLDPARAANAPNVMAATTAAAEEFLGKRSGRDTVSTKYVRALLACSHLMQGKRAEARRVVEGIQPRREYDLAREQVVIAATLYAVSACRSIEAREALERMFAKELGVEEFVKRYGSFVNLKLPPPDFKEYEMWLRQHVREIERTCFPGEGDADALKVAGKRRTNLRRLIGEQIYNDAAALVVALPPPAAEGAGPIERWLAMVGVALLVDYGHLMPDLLPMPLTEEQKQWQREQAQSLFDRGKAVAAYFLAESERKRIVESRSRGEPVRGDTFEGQLFTQLLDAEITVMGWISTR